MKDLDDIFSRILRPPRDLLISAGVPLLFLVGFLFIPSWIWFRILTGLPLLFFIPGLLFLEIINYQIDLNNRSLFLAFSIAISILLVSGLAFILSSFKNFNDFSFIISLSLLIWLEIGILYFKRDLRKTDKELTNNIFSFKKPQKGDAILAMGIALILIITSLLLAWGVPEKKSVGTNFYLLDSNKQAFDYPTHLILNQEGEVILVTICQEEEKTDYTIEIWLEINGISDLILENYSISLDPGDKNERPFSFNISNYGLFRIIFQLWVDEELIEDLYLWVEVSETRLDVSFPGINESASFTDPAQLNVNTTYDLEINITCNELNRTSYFVSISLWNSTTFPQNNLKIQWFEENLSYLLNETNNILINESLNPNQSSYIKLSFYLAEPGIHSISISIFYKEWPNNIANEKVLWVQVA